MAGPGTKPPYDQGPNQCGPKIQTDANQRGDQSYKRCKRRNYKNATNVDPESELI